MTSIDHDGELPAQRLERMKNEFLVAQQRRRERTPAAASRHDGTEDGPLLAGPAAGGPAGVAAVRP